MSDYSVSEWLRLREAPADWEPLFCEGAGDILAAEVPAYALVAGYVHRFVERGAALDAGCGEGRLAAYLDLERLAYSGFDVSPTAVSRARTAVRRGEVCECSIEAFSPPDDRFFDAVIFKGSLPSIEDPLGEIDRYLRFLTLEGVVIVSLYINPKPSGNSSLLARLLEQACVSGRYRLIEQAHTTSVTHNRAWQVFVLRASVPAPTIEVDS